MSCVSIVYLGSWANVQTGISKSLVLSFYPFLSLSLSCSLSLSLYLSLSLSSSFLIYFLSYIYLLFLKCCLYVYKVFDVVYVLFFRFIMFYFIICVIILKLSICKREGKTNIYTHTVFLMCSQSLCLCSLFKVSNIV